MGWTAFKSYSMGNPNSWELRFGDNGGGGPLLYVCVSRCFDPAAAGYSAGANPGPLWVLVANPIGLRTTFDLPIDDVAAAQDRALQLVSAHLLALYIGVQQAAGGPAR